MYQYVSFLEVSQMTDNSIYQRQKNAQDIGLEGHLECTVLRLKSGPTLGGGGGGDLFVFQ